ncbi:MAG TPA: DNA replication/repair protein RecF [Verrucomicrobiota bacterium]|nr:DNA replication and repair protein RecF [Verrucomicrobiales bacterium]HRI14690.1 DNA replication/repair protein RecF [Verrucomicrobiota bacterium]
MHLAQLRLRDFRNYARLDATFSPGFHLLLGANAQGKTNLLEAIYLLATLRSFRGAGGAQLVREQAKGYFVGATVEGQGRSSIKIYWSARERSLSLNGTPVKRLSDYLGTLRAVVFCTDDVQLVKGTSRGRRRFLDLLLTQSRPNYLTLLLRYTRALKARNALLKRPQLDEEQLAGFSTELIRVGQELIAARLELMPRIAPLAQQAFQRVSAGVDELSLDYLPTIRGDFGVALAASRTRERTYRTTLVGPHRDDVSFTVNGRPAGPFTSEGQKRTLAIALKMAQAEFLSGVHGSPPLLLIDDVMGELDSSRRAGFLPLLNEAHQAGGQVFMTCTAENWPKDLGRELVRWEVTKGDLQSIPNTLPG